MKMIVVEEKKQTHENIIKNKKKLLTYVFAVSIEVNLEGKKKVMKSNLNYYYI